MLLDFFQLQIKIWGVWAFYHLKIVQLSGNWGQYSLKLKNIYTPLF